MLKTRNRLVAVLSTVGLAVTGFLSIGAGPAQAGWLSTCDNWQSVFNGKYQVMNSKWGNTLNGWGNGWQCVGRSADDTANGWQTDLSWSNNSAFADDDYHIKAFPSTVVGWQWGYAASDSGGLPVQLSQEKNVTTTWNWQNQLGNQKSDSIYDLWVDPSTNPSGQPTDEIMVFLDYTDGAHPDSNKVATIDMDGTTWDVYRSNDSWQVISFVRTTTTNSAQLNLRDFLDYSANVGWLDRNKYLISVQAGFEIWRGAGKIITNNYSVDVS